MFHISVKYPCHNGEHCADKFPFLYIAEKTFNKASQMVQKAILFEGVIQILWQVYHMNAYIGNFGNVTKMQSYIN